MEDRRKIIIPTGAEGAEALETPHFDTEAARAARPVVPLAAQFGGAESPPRSPHYTQSELPRPNKFSPWLLSLVILAAMSVGAAAALALDYYRNHKQAEPQAAAQQTGEAVATINSRPAVKPAGETAIEAPAIHPSVNASKPEASPMTATSTAAVAPQKLPQTTGHTKAPATTTQPEPPARVEQKQDERQSPSHEARRERPPRDEESPDVSAEAKRQARRQRRPIEINPNDVPPQLKPAAQELHRIREIFEGTRP